MPLLWPPTRRLPERFAAAKVGADAAPAGSKPRLPGVARKPAFELPAADAIKMASNVVFMF
ncbi:hypothetical protein QTI51_24525 [Variovorax sp. J22G73]|nr:hypothetical protein [Variovorax sp. J22G73]